MAGGGSSAPLWNFDAVYEQRKEEEAAMGDIEKEVETGTNWREDSYYA